MPNTRHPAGSSFRQSLETEARSLVFYNSPWLAAMSPAITVIARPVDELGRQAVDMLLVQISDGKVNDSMVLPTELIIRDSVREISVNK